MITFLRCNGILYRSSPISLSVCLLLPQPKSTLPYDEISPFQDSINDFQSSLSDSVNLPLPPLSPVFPLLISVSCTLLISQYLLIYLLLCKPVMLGSCLAQPACLMRYMYKSIFLLALFHSAVSSRYFIIPCGKVLRKKKMELISNTVDLVCVF